MSIISSIFIFLLFLSMQTCNARNFKVADEVSSGQLHFSGKGLKTAAEKVMKLNLDSIQREARDGTAEKSHGDAIVLRKLLLTKSKALLHQDMKHKKGNEVIEYYSYLNLLKGAKIKDPRRRARAVLEFGSHHVKEAAKHHNKKRTHEEDVVLPDYEPPHRNPPSHNRAN